MSVAGVINTGSAAGRLALEYDKGVVALTANDLCQARRHRSGECCGERVASGGAHIRRKHMCATTNIGALPLSKEQYKDTDSLPLQNVTGDRQRRTAGCAFAQDSCRHRP